MSEANGHTRRVLLRPLLGSEGTWFPGATTLDAIRAALAHVPTVESVLAWDDASDACSVDLDVVEPLTELRLLALLEGFQPQPSLAWVTHGGGARLVYGPSGEARADEVAAVAALALAATVPHEGVELKTETRHPGAPGPGTAGRILERLQEFDERAFRGALGRREACDEDVKEWLEARGLDVGQRYDHDRCPVSPSDRGGRRPVFVGDRGIHCFICEAAGVQSGSARAGFFPYSSLCGTGRGSTLQRLLESGTHWEHARFLLGPWGAPERVRLAYSAGLVCLRGRGVADRAMCAGRNFVRMGDRWTNLSGEPYVKDLRPILSGLPACQFMKGDKVSIDRGKVVTFEQPFDLSQYGYPSLQPVFGLRMWPEDDESVGPRAVVQTRGLASEDRASFRPRLLTGDLRVAWAEVEAVCPGLRRDYLELLIIARGYAEQGKGMPPMVFVTGVTGAAKTLTAHLAASVCGDRCSEVVWTPNSDRQRQAIIDAAATGTFVAFNEPFKEARRQIKDKGQAMDYVLNLTPDSMSHVMYVGPVRMGRLPVFVWTDTSLPDEVRRDAQLARRIVHVHLDGQVDWEVPLTRSGVGHPRSMRESSEARARACDAILTDIVSRFLRPPTTFEGAAKVLGFGRLTDSEEAEEGRSALRALFDATCSAPPLYGADATRWKGRGWKLVQRDQATALQVAWSEVVDADCYTSSREAQAVDWQKVCELKEQVRLEVRSHGSSRLALRFRSAGGTRVDYRINEELR